MSWELLVLVPLAAATLVATLSFVGCSQLRRTPIDILLDPGGVSGIASVRFLVTPASGPLVAVRGNFVSSSNRWQGDLEMVADGDWRIACEVERSGSITTTPAVTRRVPPRPVNLRLVEEAGSLRLDDGTPMPPPMRVPVTFHLDATGAGSARVERVAWIESSPMSARWGPTNTGPTFVSPSIPHDQNVQLMVHCECEVIAGAGAQMVRSMTTTLQVGTTPATFIFQLLPAASPGTYRITLRP